MVNIPVGQAIVDRNAMVSNETNNSISSVAKTQDRLLNSDELKSKAAVRGVGFKITSCVYAANATK